MSQQNVLSAKVLLACGKNRWGPHYTHRRQHDGALQIIWQSRISGLDVSMADGQGRDWQEKRPEYGRYVHKEPSHLLACDASRLVSLEVGRLHASCGRSL